ncbi:hypothetical protein [Mycoplasmoides genitalium]|uniref:hypothetical protein n=1 Tax=Mycoplasmoides genitalium TaxID=2097 RepID=UPI0000557D3B|nr:hypothetical protein [Mycoplasmoides genitalium]
MMLLFALTTGISAKEKINTAGITTPLKDPVNDTFHPLKKTKNLFVLLLVPTAFLAIK